MWEISSEKSKTLSDRCFKFYIGQEISHCSRFCLFFFNPFVKSVLDCVIYAPKSADYKQHIYYYEALPEAVIKPAEHPGSRAELLYRPTAQCLCFMRMCLGQAGDPFHGKLAHKTAQQFQLSYLCETAESPKKHQWDS